MHLLPGVVVQVAGAVVNVQGTVLVVQVKLQLMPGMAVTTDLLVYLTKLNKN